MDNFTISAAAFALFFLPFPALAEQLTPAELQRIVQTVEHVPASALDTELPSTELAIWLRQVLGIEAMIQWDISDCDRKPDFSQPRETYPMCVAVRARTSSGTWMKLHFEIGTLGNHDANHPVLAETSFMVRGNIGNGCVVGFDRLSALPKQVDSFASMACCDEPAPSNSH